MENCLQCITKREESSCKMTPVFCPPPPLNPPSVILIPFPARDTPFKSHHLTLNLLYSCYKWKTTVYILLSSLPLDSQIHCSFLKEQPYELDICLGGLSDQISAVLSVYTLRFLKSLLPYCCKDQKQCFCLLLYLFLPKNYSVTIFVGTKVTILDSEQNRPV